MMDSLNSRVYIFNGQPFILQQNNINTISGDILQNALQNVDDSPNDSVQSQVNSDQFIQAVQNTEQDNCVDEFVAFKQGNGDEPSTIHLTVEQAVELGIEFNVCGIDLPSNAPCTTGEKVTSTNKDQFIFSKDPSENICLFTANNTDTSNNASNATFDSTEQGVTSASDDISKLKLDSNIIEQLNDTVNPQLTLVPQIHNGTITYTLQVDTNTETNELSTNNLSTSKDSVHMLPIETSVASSTFDLASLTTSTVTSTLVQSTLAMPPMSLSIPDTNQRNESVSFITSSNNILTETGDISNTTESENTIRNLVVYENESLPQMIESDILSNKYQRFVRLNSKTTSINSNTKTPTTLFMTVPPPLQPISTVSSSSVTSSQSVRSKTSSTGSFSLSSNQIEVQTLNLPENGSKLVAIKPSILPKGIPKEVSKVVSSFQASTGGGGGGGGEKVGSTKNPIQIVQCGGKTFKTDQQLTENQWRNVKTVLSKNTLDVAHIDLADASNNVLFDKKTNTRIIYRLIHPEDLHLKKAAAAAGDGTKKRGRPMKGITTTTTFKVGEGGEVASTTTPQPPQAAPEEPPRKKVPLPRTRSGRLSRPPRHIVRDYKRIRRLDDDMEQDGSYSDYQTDDQDDTPSDPPIDNQLLPGLAETKKRRISSSFRCPNCNKVYLGIHKMENHFFKYPDHRPPPPPPQPTDQDQSSSPTNAPPQSNSGGVSGGGGGGGGVQQRGGGVTGGSYSKRKFKRRSMANMKPDQMRAQLKQLLDLCTETELVEVVGPVLASVLSAWELLLLRVDAVTSSTVDGGVGGGKRTHALCDEIKSLLTSFTQVSAALFQPVDAADPCVLDAATFEMKDVSVSSVLGIPCGVYRVDEDVLKVDKTLSQRKTDTDSGVGGLSDAAVTHPAVDTVDVTAAAAAGVVVQKSINKGGGGNQDAVVVGVEKGVPFLLGGENVDEMICDDRTALDSNLDRFVQNFTSGSRDLSKSEVDELVFNALERGGVVRRGDLDLSLTEPFLAIGGGGRRPPHVSASTEDLIKSLENFVSADDLPSDDRTSFEAGGDNFNRVDDGVDALDFDVLSQNFHSGGANSQ